MKDKLLTIKYTPLAMIGAMILGFIIGAILV
mgnify:CR=1 FL=1